MPILKAPKGYAKVSWMLCIDMLWSKLSFPTREGGHDFPYLRSFYSAIFDNPLSRKF